MSEGLGFGQVVIDCQNAVEAGGVLVGAGGAAGRSRRERLLRLRAGVGRPHVPGADVPAGAGAAERGRTAGIWTSIATDPAAQVERALELGAEKRRRLRRVRRQVDDPGRSGGQRVRHRGCSRLSSNTLFDRLDGPSTGSGHRSTRDGPSTGSGPADCLRAQAAIRAGPSTGSGPDPGRWPLDLSLRQRVTVKPCRTAPSSRPNVGPLAGGNLRASDADREKVTTVLSTAYAEGRITREEHDERLEQVLAAKTFDELVPITQDLVLAPGDRPPISTSHARAIPTARTRSTPSTPTRSRRTSRHLRGGHPQGQVAGAQGDQGLRPVRRHRPGPARRRLRGAGGRDQRRLVLRRAGHQGPGRHRGARPDRRHLRRHRRQRPRRPAARRPGAGGQGRRPVRRRLRQGTEARQEEAQGATHVTDAGRGCPSTPTGTAAASGSPTPTATWWPRSCTPRTPKAGSPSPSTRSAPMPCSGPDLRRSRPH